MKKLKQFLKSIYEYICFTDRNLKALQEIHDGLYADAINERGEKEKVYKSNKPLWTYPK